MADDEGAPSADDDAGMAQATSGMAGGDVVRGPVLDRPFFARDAETVARELLGCVLVHSEAGPEGRSGLTRRVRLVETEAYVGTHDLACHASKGRTARTEVMFGLAGHLYVYLIYGMYNMVNIVTGREDEAAAVLLRAGEPLEGVTLATNGPGRLARAMGLDRRHNGLDLCVDGMEGEWARAGRVWVEAGEPPAAIAVGTRIGVAYAGPWADAPLRFADPVSPAVSVPIGRGR